MAERQEIAEEIERLAVHCRPPLMSVEDRMTWVADWCQDLSGFPIAAIRMACTSWRNGTDRKFPLPGQLKPLIRVHVPSQKGEVGPQVWRPLSDDEYGALTIMEKVRHHLIMAAEAGSKAGPMFRNTSLSNGMSNAKGEHLTADQMPQTWHDWKARQAGHLAEAKRLREIKRLHAA